MSNMTPVPDINKNPLVDMWSSTANNINVHMLAASWVPVKHRRRLASYTFLAAIYNNAHKLYLEREEIREYGDAALVVDTLRDGLIGSTGIKISSDDIETNAATKKRIERLRKWWKAELMDMKLFENETNCASLGDSVYRVRWSAKNKKKPTVKVDTFDPGFFFPEFDEDNDLVKAHLAWEEEVIDEAGNQSIYVYKETYELDENGMCLVTAGWYDTCRNDSMSDLQYTLDYLKLVRYKVDADGNEFNNTPLNIDFIPIIYVPNIAVQGEPYGKSDLSTVIDLLEEMAHTNTDTAANTSLLGSPPLVIQSDGAMGGDVDENGNQIGVQTVGAGQVIEVGAGGDAKLLDVSGANSALDVYYKKLDQKLYENTRATKLAAGKMEGSTIPSGIALRLLQNPLVQKTLPKRILRQYKFNLLLKYVQKMFLLFGTTEDKSQFVNDEYEVDITFGDIFPTDRSAAINDLAVAYAAGFMSLEVAVRMSQKYGVDIDDVMTEVERIKDEKIELNTFTNIGTGTNGTKITMADPRGKIGTSDGVQSGNMQKTADGSVKSDNKDSTQNE